MNRQITLTCNEFTIIQLRTATTSDQENLRIWKNSHRTSFFYQEIIQPEQQMRWFEKYQNRPDDCMFMVEELCQEKGKDVFCSIGCMAFRIEDENTIDLYNIIRGEQSKGKASMKDAMHMMLAYIWEMFPDKRIKCDVLKENPAVKWYQKCGFDIWEEKEYYIMGIDKTDIPTIHIMIDEEE